MATRKEVRERCDALREDIRVSYKKGTLTAGMRVPPVRELAVRFGLSSQVAHQEVQRMVEEGLLYSVPGSGTFMGTPPTKTSHFFLIVAYDRQGVIDPMEVGFAHRVATLGGASLSLTPEEIHVRNRVNAIPPLAGVLDSYRGVSDDFPWGPLRREVPRVGSFGYIEDPGFMDGVGIDDVEGGRQAATHLLRMGHRRIAFLGVHGARGPVPGNTQWSERREAGWKSVLDEAGLPSEGLSFHPEDALAPPEHDWHLWPLKEAARSAARHLAARADVTAVVAANDDAAITYIKTLHELGVPAERWPAVVGYDNLPNPKGQILSSLHRPLDKVGAAAADILWERWQGKIKDRTPVLRRVPMILLPRITSESGWALRMPDAISMLLEKNAD